MISAQEDLSSPEEATFDTYEIDNQITKKEKYIQKIKRKNEEILNKFKHLSSLTEEQLKNKDLNSDYPKYFAKIDTKDFKYLGILSNQLKRVQYGYSNIIRMKRSKIYTSEIIKIMQKQDKEYI